MEMAQAEERRWGMHEKMVRCNGRGEGRERRERRER
jgi:hypothetical protein